MREHADVIEGLRYRLEAVRFTGVYMVRDRQAYGTMCEWVADCLDDRFAAQDGLVESVAKNLEIAVEMLRAAADAHDGKAGAPPVDAVRRATYWIPEEHSALLHREPEPRLADQIQVLVDQIAGRGWADERLAHPPLDGVGDLPDFAPLRDLLPRLVGRPDVVASQVATWNELAAELRAIGAELETELDRDRPYWQGESHAAYRVLMDHNVNAIGGIAATAAALAAAVEGAGAVVRATIAAVREQSAELAGWAAVAEPGPRRLAAAGAKWTLMVATRLIALAASLDNLREMLYPKGR